MRENLFKLGQRVRQKNMLNGYAFSIRSITLHGDHIHYADNVDGFSGFQESELELVKEKKKVTLCAPARKDKGSIFLNAFYHNGKDHFENYGDIVGWHEIVVEVDDE